MTYRFVANIAYGWHEDLPPGVHVPTAGVAESADEESFALDFQGGAEEPDEQDVRLGMDSYCVITPDQNAAYGCVRTVELERGLLRVTFDPASLEDLGLNDPVLEAVLHAPAEDVARMREALKRILAYGRPGAVPIVLDA
ncbi:MULTISPECIES: Imm10 family immunity protein [unclassified Streptomyces]|uniref:Imm10 family immunity protein n=1 Tax=unclassified Streptomyces TaxID=2593676 RepID=UPI0004C3F70C